MNPPNRILVSVTNDIVTDQRVLKVCGFLQRRGFDVTIIGRLREDSLSTDNIPFKTKRFRLWFNKGFLFYAHYNLRLFFYLLGHRSEWLLANDLDTLPANYLASILNRNRKLVYDSHEFYTGVTELVHRPRTRRVWERIEQFIFPRLNRVYTVNESIAKLYSDMYKKTVLFVRNAPLLQERVWSKTKSELGLPEDKFLVILQGAGINVSRGAEEAVEAMHLLNNVALILIGAGDVMDVLKEKVAAEKLQDRVLFFPKMPFEELMQYTMQSDVGLTLDKDVSLNYKYALPNKLFDYIHAGIPVIASRLIEVEKLINKYEVGLLTEEVSPVAIAKSIKQLQTDEALRMRLRENTKTARKNLNWQNEEKILEKIYG